MIFAVLLIIVFIIAIEIAETAIAIFLGFVILLAIVGGILAGIVEHNQKYRR
jgi:hypothetical protein